MRPAFYQPKVNLTVIAITGLIIVLSVINYDLVDTIQYALLVIGTLIIGIPHGATDDHIFYAAGLEKWLPGQKKGLFYLFYLLIAGFYTLFWLLWPVGALGLFLLLSIYHFGQSHLFYFTYPSPNFPQRVFYLAWGAYALMLPIMFQYQEALPVIRTLIGFEPLALVTMNYLAMPLAVGLFAVNSLAIAYHAYQQAISLPRALLEIINLLVLGLLAYTTPLFVAFITYWALWHSLNSVFEIRNFLAAKIGNLSFKAFGWKAFPLTLVTVVGIGLLFWLTGSLGQKDELLAVFFIVIATVTLPHSIVMERLYQENKSTGYSATD